MFPNADQIAIAIVGACELTAEDPFEVVSGEIGQRARYVALDALATAFPDARRQGLTRCVGFLSVDQQGNAMKNLKNQAKRSRWWREEWVDEVVGALVADQYGEQAA